jgi:hypothetical protein
MKGYRTKRIVLPGGRVIEIVYFSDAEAGAAEATPARAETAVRSPEPQTAAGPVADTRPLHMCPACDGEMVYPVAWEERDDDHWRIERRCPNCEWRHIGEFDQTTVEAFDDVLNDGTEELLTTLRDFSRANMAADIERFIEAMHGDRIEPMDF